MQKQLNERFLRPAVWLVLTAGILFVAWYVLAPKGVIDDPLPPVVVADAAAAVLTTPEPTDVPNAEVVVYVTGAVARPGLYALAHGERVGAAVAAAGGLTSDASYDEVNMAERLGDAQHIRIPFRSTESPAPVATDTQGEVPAQIAINTATAAELEQLPGVGASMAERIVAYRTTHGPFMTLADLDAVSGIGSALLAKLEPYVRF